MIRRIIVLITLTALLASCSVQQPVELSQQELSRNWEFRQAGKAEWMPAVVPGAVQRTF